MFKGKSKIDDAPEMAVADDDVIEADAEEVFDEEEEVADAEKEAETNAVDELKELQNKYLRLAAEFDNYRKRTLREKAELMQYAGEGILKDILPLVDDFERGMDQASKANDMEAMLIGMDLIYNKFKDFLSSKGVKEISAMNEPFDTDWHEAVVNIQAPSDDMKGKIIDVIQKGYTLNDKIIRYSKVVVGE